MIDYCKFIRDTRTEKNLTQKELAKRAGTDQRHISLIERGKRDVSLAVYLRIIKALGFWLKLEKIEK